MTQQLALLSQGNVGNRATNTTANLDEQNKNKKGWGGGERQHSILATKIKGTDCAAMFTLKVHNTLIDISNIISSDCSDVYQEQENACQEATWDFFGFCFVFWCIWAGAVGVSNLLNTPCMYKKVCTFCTSNMHRGNK